MNRSKTISKKAYAKINLFLNVAGKRPDGYHNLEMVNARIDLADDLTFAFEGSEKVTLISNDKFLENRANIVYKTAYSLLEERGESRNITIQITKRIPAGAGLAGNSADCAMVIEGLNELCGWNLNKSRMQVIGQRFGADVPYCFETDPAVVEGLGEIITPFNMDFQHYRVIVQKPDDFVSTEAVFRIGDEIGFPHYDITPLRNAISKQNVEDLIDGMKNGLEPITFQLSPTTRTLYEEMRAAYGARGLVMTGSGSAIIKILSSTDSLISDKSCANRDKKTIQIHRIL
jgi:4-diphosphocytidyl-2-C-methyl-D-erythritol kinase